MEEEYREYLSNKYNNIRYMVARKVAAEDVPDVVQEVCLQFTRSVRIYEGKCSLDTWLNRIVRKTIATHYRKKNRKVEGRITATEDKDIPQGVSLPVLPIQLEDALGFLPENYQEVFALYFWNDLSYTGIAKQLHLSYEAVRSRHRRALAFCRKNMSLVMDNLSVERDIDIEWQNDQVGIRG